MALMHSDEAPGRRPGVFYKLARWWGAYPIMQIVLIAVLLGTVYVLISNTAATMTRIGITPGFAFLGRSANFEIGEGPISFAAGDPYIRAILLGFLNTLKVAALGCVLATLLGVAVGIAGLSGNLLLAGFVRGYVEIIRNTPLLLQLFFWIALAKSFPPPRQALPVLDSIFLSNRGIFVPGLVFQDFSTPTWSLIALAAIAVGLFLRTAFLRRALTLGKFGIAVLILGLGVALAVQTTGANVVVDIPALAGFNIRGGRNLTPEFAALLIGLTIKFSAAIAEIVRSGIQSVGTGQWEAARTLGLRKGQILRLVVLPQAMRVITPLTTSSYLDLIKDSSLAVAIGYPDLVSVINTTANTTGQSFEALAILIGAYLVLNLSVSAGMNIYNNRVALRGTHAR
jgi:general L-amino acid transport system permease protein